MINLLPLGMQNSNRPFFKGPINLFTKNLDIFVSETKENQVVVVKTSLIIMTIFLVAVNVRGTLVFFKVLIVI